MANEQGAFVDRECFPDSSINRPTGTTFFDDGPALIETDVTDFSFTGDGAVKNCAVDGQSSAHAASKRHVKNRVAVFAGTADGSG